MSKKLPQGYFNPYETSEGYIELCGQFLEVEDYPDLYKILIENSILKDVEIQKHNRELQNIKDTLLHARDTTPFYNDHLQTAIKKIDYVLEGKEVEDCDF